MPSVELAFLWHMHQPPYRDPLTGAYLLPWVRLHATRAYADMAAIHERFPAVKSTVNFVPVLLEQLEDYVEGRADDLFVRLTEKPADALEAHERKQLLRSFFMVSWEQGVRPLPRYWELLHERGLDLSRVDLDEVAGRFDDGKLRDLQVLFNLAWMGFWAREELPAVRALLDKGRDFTEEDKGALLEAQREILAGIVPRWRSLQERGQVELSATPYFHPILPLVCDTDEAKIALPQIPLPPRMRAPEDAEEHIERALGKFEEVFGRRPVGMWPAEGSVSPEALAMLAKKGIRWTASDEEVLFRSIPPGSDRARSLYRPWSVRAGDSEIAMVFRDHGLSDRIGFSYAHSGASEAVDDFLAALGGAGADEPLVSVILDGENPWEHYPDSGRHFLMELFARLSKGEGGVRTSTISEVVARGLPPGRIEKIHSGSWIEANYRIWIGHDEDVRAWALLGEARAAWEKARRDGVSEERIAAAREHLLAAEASDWFWWYGEDFVSENAAEFDALFRGHVERIYRELDLSVPPSVHEPIAAEVAKDASADREPIGFIHPRINGRADSFRDWLGAGTFRADQSRGGSMHQRVGLFSTLYFGFDAETLYLRLDPAEGVGERFVEELDGLRVQLRTDEGERELAGPLRAGSIALADDAGAPLGKGEVRAIVELAIPFAELGFRRGQRVGVALRGLRGPVELERIPARGWVSFEVPDVHFERELWKV